MTQKTIYLATRQLKNGELIYLRGFDTEQQAKDHVHLQEEFLPEKWTYFIAEVPFGPNKLDNWISVKDNLPIIGQCIIFYSPDKNINVCFGCYKGKYKDNTNWFVDYQGFSIDSVTHWMPLPSEPK